MLQIGSVNTLQENPFRIQGVVEPPFFTDRADELRRVRDALRAPAGRLLVHGERRMGKTSLLHVARLHREREGGAVVLADLSTASSAADMANRVLESAGRALGRGWRDFAGDIAARLRVRVQLVPDPATGLALPTLEASLRAKEPAEQTDSLVGVLDALQAMAAARDATLGVVLDEFQEIHRFGGEAAEWALRGAMQHHDRLSYVLAGSDSVLIRQMLGRNRAFYEMFETLELGPIEPAHLARWIDERMRDAGAEPSAGLGDRVAAVAGARTRDVVRLARACFAESTPGDEARAVVRAGLSRVVADEDDRMRVTWTGLTPLQQNVLRAIAWGGAGLTSRETLERFGLGHGGTARNSALALEGRGLLVQRQDGWSFDSPFARAWVVANALPDAGVLVPIDHLPGDPAP